MHTFFHGWRRKAGIISLVVACVMTGLWNRSLFVEDLVAFPRRQAFDSLNGNLYWDSGAIFTFNPGWCAWRTHDLRNPRQLEVSLAHWEQSHSMRIPYWSMVSPLTLLSAYLLLWKPRHRRDECRQS